MRALESLASLLGPNQVFFLSQDDKCRVPIGLKAAHKQSPILMHLEYKVKLPDHDWVIADKHKLIPSVYAAVRIKPEGLGHPEAVSYSGPTFVAVRSGKNDSSTAASHAVDFDCLMELEDFDAFTKFYGKTKPIMIDGGPDENPRYAKVIALAIEHFEKYNMDAIFIATNAPGRSCYNRVERRMAPLSCPLSGVILRHDTFDTHLDSRGKTMDKELELKNINAAGNALADIWNETVIDGYPVIAEFVDPNQYSDVSLKVDQEWYMTHVRETQHLFQISKCCNTDCYGTMRSDIRYLLPDGFLTPPELCCQYEETRSLK